MLNIDKELKRIVGKYPETWQKQERLESKNNILLIRAGEIITKSYYIESGILKCCLFDEDIEKDVILDLLSTGDAILPYNITSRNVLSPFDIQVIGKAVIYSISNDDLDILQEKEPILNELTQLNAERMITRMIKISIINASNKALIRYKKLLEVYPYLRDISDQEVASILGIDRATVNRKKIELMKIERDKEKAKQSPKNKT